MYPIMKTLITVGNIYVDHNIFGVEAGQQFCLEANKDYYAEGGEQVVGGSAVNVAMQLKKLGNDVAVIAKVGDDVAAQQIRQMLQRDDINTELLSVGEGLSTSVAINIVSENGEFTGLHYGDASRELKLEDINLNHSFFEQTAGIYFGGTIKQPLVFEYADELFRKLSEKGVKVFFDPNRFPPEDANIDRSLIRRHLSYVEGYFANESELLQASNTSHINEALESVLQTGVKFIAVKLGANGCRVKTLHDDFTVDGHSIEPITTVGAGDCFNATFISYYLDGCSLREAAEHATAASAIKVAENIWPTKPMFDNLSS